jgi:hypothetical protein
MKHVIASLTILLILPACLFFLSGCQKKENQNQVTASDIFTENSDIPAKVGKGWHKIEQSGPRNLWRWTEQDAEVVLEPSSDAKASVVITLKSFHSPRQCNVMLGDKLLVSKSVPQDGLINIETPVSLVKGSNVLRITSPDKSQAPASIPELKSHDVRNLSFVVFSIAIKKIG